MIKALMIVEIMGKPGPFIRDALEKHVSKLKSAKAVEVFSIEISEPKEIENSEGMMTCFAEVEFGTENFSRMTEVVFDFMPSSVEILEPSKVEFSMEEASRFLNNVSGRMHRYDDVAKVAKAQTQQLAAKLKMAQEKLLDVEKGSKKKVKKSSKKKSSKKSKKKR